MKEDDDFKRIQE